jgi:hypothetical protein
LIFRQRHDAHFIGSISFQNTNAFVASFARGVDIVQKKDLRSAPCVAAFKSAAYGLGALKRFHGLVTLDLLDAAKAVEADLDIFLNVESRGLKQLLKAIS